MSEQEIPVLVVGGSLVGLTTSVLLASHGVRHMLIERHRGTAIHPRAASFHQRTMEIFRSLGLQQAVEAAAEREFVQNGAIISVDTLSGKELACFYRSFNEGVEGLSPSSRLFITQIGLEPVLRERARELGADHHYATELVSFEQDDAGVVAVLRPRDGGPQRRVRARYLVAADGTHSFVRGQLGIGMAGRGSFADCVTIYFKADLRALIGNRSLSVIYVNQPGLLAFFRFSISGDAGFLAVFATFDEDGNSQPSRPEPFSGPLRRSRARGARGAGRIPCRDRRRAAMERERRHRDRVSQGARLPGRRRRTSHAPHRRIWRQHRHRRRSQSRVEARNGTRRSRRARLLDSYESERKPQCELIVEQAYARYVKRVDPSLPASNLAPLLDDAAIELGSVYRSDAILEMRRSSAAPRRCSRTRASPAAVRERAYLTSRCSGTVSPFPRTISSKAGFVLLAGAGGRKWTEAGNALAAVGIPLRAYRIAPDGDLTNPTVASKQTWESAHRARCCCDPTASSAGARAGRTRIRAHGSMR